MRRRWDVALRLASLLAACGALFDAAPGRADSIPSPATASPTPVASAPPPALAAASVPGDSTVSEDLGPTTAVPWNSARPVPEAEPWETALRLPGRAVSLPLSALGYWTKRGMIKVEEADIIPKVVYYLAVLPRLGLTLAPASLGDRTGLGLQAKLELPPAAKTFAAGVEASTREYSSTRLVLRHGPLGLEYGQDWRPRERFFGLGMGGDDDAPTTFASQSQHVRLGLDQTLGRDRPWRLGLAGWAGPREIVTRAGREPPSFDQAFPGLAGALDRRVEHFVSGARVTLDGRRGVPHWSRGARLAAQLDHFGRPVKALALRTSEAPFPFTRYEYFAEGGLSFHRDPRTVRLAVRAVDNRFAPGVTLLPPDLASLGGREGLHGFEPGRFHEADLVVGRLAYIFPIAIRFELDVHAEAGAVYGDVWRDARLSSLETSYGVALRPRLDNAVLGAVGIDWSGESVRFRYSVGGVE